MEKENNLNNEKYYIKHQFPSNKEFLKLFKSVGWKRENNRVDKNRENSCFAVCVYLNKNIVGMGRIVGDGSYFTIYDVVVSKKYQGLGIGSVILSELIKWYKTIKDDDTFLYCGASKNREKFYEKFGFRTRPNEEVGSGMKWYE